MAMTSDLKPAKLALETLSGGKPLSVLAAVSGGLDSMCLLHLLAAWGKEQHISVTAAHFNHQLRETASRDEEFVRNWCAANEIPFVSGCGDVRGAAQREGWSIEEAARNLRYAFLEEQQKKLGCAFVLTAHHADDNAETMLLHLLRGTGLRGLTGIPETRDDLFRPFLQVTRTELEDYAAVHDIPHVEDETNALDEASRNVLRHQVLPVLRQLNPGAVKNMTRTMQLLTEDEAALEQATGELLRYAVIEAGRSASLPLERCRTAPKAVVKRALLSLMSTVAGQRRDLSAVHVEAVLELLHGVRGQEISLPYGMTARAEAERIIICRRSNLAKIELNENCPVIWGDYQLTLLPTVQGEGLVLRTAETICIAPCPPGERLRLPDAKGSRSVKRLCIDRKIPLWERECLPAVYADGRLAAVWPLGTDVEFLPEHKESFRFVQILKYTEERER